MLPPYQKNIQVSIIRNYFINTRNFVFYETKSRLSDEISACQKPEKVRQSVIHDTEIVGKTAKLLIN